MTTPAKQPPRPDPVFEESDLNGKDDLPRRYHEAEGADATDFGDDRETNPFMDMFG